MSPLQYDPLEPVYASEATQYVAPQLNKVNEQLGQTKGAADYLNPETDTVEGRTGNILSSGGLLNQKTQQRALDIGNSRGLLNSRGTAMAGTSALIDKAVGIATPDAATYSSFGKVNQATDNQGLLNNQTASLQQQQNASNAQLQGALTDQAYGNTANLSNQQYQQTGGLNNQTFQNTSKLADQSFTNTKALNDQTFQNTSKLADQATANQIQINEVQAQIAQDYKAFTFEFDKALVELGIDAQERQNIANSMSAQTQTMMNIMGSVMNNPDLVPNQNTHTWASDFMYKGWEAMASLYKVDIEVV